MAQDKEHYVCNYTSCRKIFSRKYDWNRHLDGHLGINYHCDDCNKGFSRRYNLDLHKRSCKGKTDVTSIEATIIKVQPVLEIPLKTSYEKPFNDAPPKNTLAAAWVKSAESFATDRAIRILSKYQHNSEIATPTPALGIKPQATAPSTITGSLQQTPIVPIIQPTAPVLDNTYTRRPTLPMAHTSDHRRAQTKHVTFQQPSLISAQPKPKREGFKLVPGHKRRLDQGLPKKSSTGTKNIISEPVIKPEGQFSKKL